MHGASPCSMNRKPKTKIGRTIKIELPQGAFPFVMYANTFGIEVVDGHKLIHFGLELLPNRLLGAWACLLEGSLIEHEKDNWLNYLREISFPQSANSATFRCPPEKLACVPLSNLVTWCRSGELAEMRLFNYAAGYVLEGRRNGEGETTIKGQGLALIRCTLDMQRQLLETLYQEFPV